MARILRIEGSHFIGSPLVAYVEPTAPPSGATFHRVCVEVLVNREGKFNFSTPVDGTATVRFDISSALVAFAEGYVYSAADFRYPTFAADVNAWDEWMYDGSIWDNRDSHGTMTVEDLCCGELPDIYRLTSERLERYSRKPTSSPQVAFVGSTFLQPGPCFNGSAWVDPAVTQHTVTEGANAGVNVYGIAAPQDGYELRFINTLGVHENVFVRCLRKTEVSIQTDRHVIARQETIGSFSRGLAIKKNSRERWKLSSGPLDLQWQQWWLHDLLMARWAWIPIVTTMDQEEVWLPVHILPDETTQGVDRVSGTPMTVEFTVEFDLNGSLIL